MYAEAKSKSILHYVRSMLNIPVDYRGTFYVCSSPFASDTTPSFIVYPDNKFKCWSTGISGDIIDLIRLLENTNFSGAIKFILTNKDLFKDHDELDFGKHRKANINKKFDYTNYINTDEEEVKNIFDYASQRGLVSGFLPGAYYRRRYSVGGKYSLERVPSVMFIHVDTNLKICGAKFRSIYDNINPRFTARGHLGLYVIDVVVPDTFRTGKNWLVESETSANSLSRYLQQNSIPARVISFGGVSSAPMALPMGFTSAPNNLIIDYDGDELLYQQRLKKYEHLNVNPIKMVLPKGEDINSLYCKKKMYLVEHLLLN